MDTEQHVNLIDIPTLVAEVPEGEWTNRELTEVHGAAVRLGVIEGEYHWHVHADSEELFMTLEGVVEVEVRVEGEEFSYVLGAHQMCIVPAGIEHRTCASERASILMLERSGTRPEGD